MSKTLGFERMNQILLDIGIGRKPVGYTDEELEFRKEEEAEFAEFEKTHPGAYIDIASDVPDWCTRSTLSGSGGRVRQARRMAEQGVAVAEDMGSSRARSSARSLPGSQNTPDDQDRLAMYLTASFLVASPTEVMVTRRETFEPTAALDLTLTLTLRSWLAPGASDGVW